MPLTIKTDKLSVRSGNRFEAVDMLMPDVKVEGLELIADITLAEDSAIIDVATDSNGQPYSLSRFFVLWHGHNTHTQMSLHLNSSYSIYGSNIGSTGTDGNTSFEGIKLPNGMWTIAIRKSELSNASMNTAMYGANIYVENMVCDHIKISSRAGNNYVAGGRLYVWGVRE